jgi:hypothetical protein
LRFLSGEGSGTADGTYFNWQPSLSLLGKVNADPAFRAHPAVIKGCSGQFAAIFGDAGRHARSAIGVAS